MQQPSVPAQIKPPTFEPISSTFKKPVTTKTASNDSLNTKQLPKHQADSAMKKSEPLTKPKSIFDPISTSAAQVQPRSIFGSIFDANEQEVKSNSQMKENDKSFNHQQKTSLQQPQSPKKPVHNESLMTKSQMPSFELTDANSISKTPERLSSSTSLTSHSNPNIDPKIEAMNIVSEIDKQQKSNITTPKKKGLGPAETGSLLKHKELQQNKFSTKTQQSSVSNYVDFDSSDSSLGSFEGNL